MSALGAPLSAFGAAPGAVQPPRARAGKSRAAGETLPPPRGSITMPRRALDSRPPPRRRGKDKRILVFGDPPMSGLTRATAVGTTLVAALALVVGTYPAEGADKAKAKDAPAKTKARRQARPPPPGRRRQAHQHPAGRPHRQADRPATEVGEGRRLPPGRRRRVPPPGLPRHHR